jgi:hypothetical protein
VVADFPKENDGVRQALINSDSLRDPLVTIDGEAGNTGLLSSFSS